MTSTAYLLISHGSRDPRHQIAINRLAQLLRERLNEDLSDVWPRPPVQTSEGVTEVRNVQSQSLQLLERQQRELRMAVATAEPVAKSHGGAPNLGVRMRSPRGRCIVGTAVLEFAPLPLHQQIAEFGRRLSSAGVKRLQLVPLFLLRGKHVMDDIPEEVALAQHELGDLIEIKAGEHLGGYPAMAALIAKRLSHTPKKGRLLVAHGSRRAKGNRSVDKLAKSLGTDVAYWTNDSEIEHQTIQLMQQGCSTLTIFPYFLFAGGITDAVAHLTEELAERFPRTNFRLLPPLGATADMANLLVKTLQH
ncbi:sirohydrochlorin chelatase [Leptothoe kymatousa]|uniref:Sirohydrochlorin chelatase n=1 Tax=Leptothoe kymatousa TAU-MAC 1615 TaxID=2364775 RepID=A0ABS5Y395_9CYAN|nr:sirohydrochlorin chelatase [Leptothoe kymatousa]MBT9312091.1 sirohydrochlorin chelatase [Leptothoe kymatousa TAU-MAC 1615]